MSFHGYPLSLRMFPTAAGTPRGPRAARNVALTASRIQKERGTAGSCAGVLPTRLRVNLCHPARSLNPKRQAVSLTPTPASRSAIPWLNRIHRSATDIEKPCLSAVSERYSGRQSSTLAVLATLLRYSPLRFGRPYRGLERPGCPVRTKAEEVKPETPSTSWSATMRRAAPSIGGPGHAFRKKRIAVV